jgi:demethylspheroidene O-methyltransferase
MAVTLPESPPIGLIERWRGWRDRLLASADFQRFAAAFPLTRPIARRRAAELFDLCAGFVYSQVLTACVRLRLFQHLRAGPLDLAALSQRLQLPPERALLLLNAAASLRLVERRGAERFGLGPLGAALLGNPGVAAMVEHHAALYADLADPVALLRAADGKTALGAYWPYAAGPQASTLSNDQVAAYTALMSASQPMIATEALAGYPFARHRRLLDVGGGDGSFLIAVARAAPALDLMLFDLPPVADIARQRFAVEGVSARTAICAGSFLADPLPEGADVISLVRVVHDHDDAAVETLLRKARAALEPGGALVLVEPMAGEGGAGAAADAYFGFYLRAMGAGRPRSFTQLRAMLLAAGFAQVERRATRIPMLCGLIVARI